MASRNRPRSHLYVFALLASSAMASSPVWAVEGYNINEGSELGAATSATRKALPRFTDFRGPAQPPAVSDIGLAKPEPIVLTPPLSAQTSTGDLTQTSAKAPLVQPVTEVAMPSKPLYPERSGAGETSMPNYDALVGAKPAPSAPAQASVSVAQPAAAKAAEPAPSPLSAPAPALNVPEAPKVVAAKLAPSLSPLPDVQAPRATQVASSSSALPSLPPPPAPLTSAKAMREAEQKVDAVMASAPNNAPAKPAVLAQPAASAKQDSIEIETIPARRVAATTPAVVPPAPEVVGSAVSSLPAPQIASATSRAEPALQQPASPLSSDSKKILASLRPVSANSRPERAARLDMKRVNPEVADIVKKAEEVYESSGVSIRVSGSTQDVTTELGDAYEALMGGETSVAIRMYQDILSRNPANEEALFGLAATYHRTGQIDNARPLYGRLLAQNPNHREALNNFLMLVANESPRDALEELARLETRNPEYSPIPAQMGIIFDKLGEHELAQNKMLRAIKLSPENWVYKYNLAIMFDRQRAYADAAAIYKELINASLQGESMPIDMEALQARLNYIAART